MCLLLCTGVFSDILNLIFRDKSCSQITSEGVKIVGNLDTAEMKQREHILAKCLEFLKLLARYTYVHVKIIRTYIINFVNKSSTSAFHLYNFNVSLTI